MLIKCNRIRIRPDVSGPGDDTSMAAHLSCASRKMFYQNRGHDKSTPDLLNDFENDFNAV